MNQVKAIAVAVCLMASFSCEARAENAVGMAMISLPGISDRQELGFVYENSTSLDTPVPWLVDFISLHFFLFPSIKLIEPAQLFIEDDHASLGKGNAIAFDSRTAVLTIASPGFGSCFLSGSMCWNASPLSLPVFSGGSQLRIYSSPMLGAEYHWSRLGRRGWYFSFESIVFQNQNLMAAGFAF